MLRAPFLASDGDHSFIHSFSKVYPEPTLCPALFWRHRHAQKKPPAVTELRSRPWTTDNKHVFTIRCGENEPSEERERSQRRAGEVGRGLLGRRKSPAQTASGREARGSERKGGAIRAEGAACAKAPGQVRRGGKRLVWAGPREAGGEQRSRCILSTESRMPAQCLAPG